MPPWADLRVGVSFSYRHFTGETSIQFFPHRRDAKLAEKMIFLSGGERPPEKKPSQPLRGKGSLQVSAGGREAAFYPTASHGRIKENSSPLRPLRLCGEYVSVFMKRCTKLMGDRKEFPSGRFSDGLFCLSPVKPFFLLHFYR